VDNTNLRKLERHRQQPGAQISQSRIVPNASEASLSLINREYSRKRRSLQIFITRAI
jgi:hypothetical protein